jgi:hypothetical protein
MQVSVEEEYLHLPPSSKNLLWIESYAFNGYDPVKEIGIVTYTGINPASGVKIETITLHSKDPLFFQNIENFEKEDAFESGVVRMEPLIPLKKWRIYMKDSFKKIENGYLSHSFKEVELDLHFDSITPPYRFFTNRGDRYEQPGLLKGKVRIGEETMDFKGRGIRDHSWEIRNVPTWGQFYWLMGCFTSGESVSFTYMGMDDNSLCHGWLRTGEYHEIQRVQMNPGFSGNFLRECQMCIETSRKVINLNVEVLSNFSFPQKLISFVSPSQRKIMKTIVVENLVQLEKRGYGFLWYGKKL